MHVIKNTTRMSTKLYENINDYYIQKKIKLLSLLELSTSKKDRPNKKRTDQRPASRHGYAVLNDNQIIVNAMKKITRILKISVSFIFILTLCSNIDLWAQAPVWHQTDLQENNGSSGNATVNKPTNLNEGDLIILVVSQLDDNTLTPPSGFTEIVYTGGGTDGGTQNTGIGAYWKIATASEPATYTITRANTSAGWHVAAARVTGHSPSDPIGSFNEAAGGGFASQGITVSGFNTAYDNALIVAALATHGPISNISVPSGMTPSWANGGQTPGNVGATEVITNAGFTGDKRFTWSTSRRRSVILFEINTDFCNPASGNPDTDGDGLTNICDIDDDNDGILDDVEGTLDSDLDGRTNNIDLDSDNDGIPDNIEAFATQDYLKPSYTVGDNGYHDNYETATDNGTPIAALTTLADTDGDGTPDYLDDDSNQNGTTDLDESFATIGSGPVGTNGLFNNLYPADDYLDVNSNAYNDSSNEFTNLLDSNNDMLADGSNATNVINFDWRALTDTDGDGIADTNDLDNDNDGILDVDENFGYLGSDFTNENGSGLGLVTGSTVGGVGMTLNFVGVGGGTIITGPFSDNRDLTNPISYAASPFPGVSGVNHVMGHTTRVNSSQRVDLTITFNEPMLKVLYYVHNQDFHRRTFTGNHQEKLLSAATEVIFENRQWRDSIPGTVSNESRDGFGILEITPLDGAETFTTIQLSYTLDPNVPGAFEDGSAFAIKALPVIDTDGDGIPNYLDLDSDNDGIFDSIEAGANPANLDANGIVTGGVNAEGVPLNANSGAGFTVPDTDGTELGNPYDIDSDADGCSDANEYYNRPGVDGGDGDGRVGNSGDAGYPIVNPDNGLITNANSTGTFTYISNGSSNYTDDLESSACTLSLTDGPCWRTLAAPNNGVSYADFFASFDSRTAGGLWTQGVDTNGDPIGGVRSANGPPNVYTLNAAGDDWVPVSNLNATFTPGTGVLISVFADDDFDGTDDGWPKESDLFTLSTQNEVTGRSYNVAASSTITTTDDGYNLVGNPFNSAVDFSAITRTGNVENKAWVYDRIAGDWIAINDASLGDIDDGIIAAGQGFIVRGDGQLQFNEDDKVDPGTPAANSGTFYGKQAERRLPDHLRLELRGQGIKTSAWIQLSEGGSLSELTSSDVEQFYPFSQEFAILSTLKADQLLDIGHFPHPGEQDLRIPLTIETTSGGELTLELTDLQLPGVTLFLHDTVTGESVQLTEGATYSFNAEATIAKRVNTCLSAPTGFLGPQLQAKDAGPRFYISAEAMIGSGGTDLPTDFNLEQNYPNPFNPTTQITYQLPRDADVRLEVFDMAGRQVATLVSRNEAAGTYTVNFDASNLSSGVYMYRLQAGATVLTKKLTLIK
jgi:hypothetical protein